MEEQKNTETTNEYYSRTCINPNFALEQWNQGIAAGTKFYEGIGLNRTYDFYTYARLRLTQHKNIAHCLTTLRDGWKKAFPNNPDAVEYLVIPNDGSEAAETLYQMYGLYFGWDSYLRICTELFDIVPIMRAKKSLKNILSYNYLLSIDAGGGFTMMLSSFSDYLDKLKIFDNPSKVHFEIKIGAETKNGCRSIDDTIDTIAKEDNYYTVFGIDICYFLDKGKYDDLRGFINRLYKYQDKYVFIFRVPFLEKDAIREIHDIIDDVVCTKDIIITPPNEVELLEYFTDEIIRAGYTIDNEALKIFFEKVKEEKVDGRFYNFKTVAKIKDEVCWLKAQKCAEAIRNNEVYDANVISASDILSLCHREIKIEKSGYEELNELVGMNSMSDRIKEIVAQVKLAIIDKSLDRPCIHMRFLGSPGTGKTTVARIVGKILKEEGILRKGNFIECNARSLCGEYVGQTAPKTASICRDAYGSVLFIDEAYSLYTGDGSKNDYGKEALATLISEMENHRTDMVVIMAGYTDDMNILMEGNSGLRSRMPYMIEFKNYSREQLYDIFMLMLSKHFEYDKQLETVARDYFNSLSNDFVTSKEFANARFVRNLYERVWSKAALRTTFSGSNTIYIVPEDFRSAVSDKEFHENIKTTSKRVGY